MTEAIAKTRPTRGDAEAVTSSRFVRDPTTWRDELLRYAASAIATGLVGGILIHVYATRADSIEATETEQAVLIDLPAALSSSQPASEAQEGPQQEAADAAPATPPVTPQQQRPLTDPPPPPIEVPRLPDAPIVDPPMEVAQPKIDVPLPPLEDLKPIEPTIEPPKRVDVHPPTPPAATPSPAADAQAPAGSDAPVAGQHPETDEGQPHASARAITAWQRALVGRLEVAKRLLANGVRHAAMGTVQVAFTVDRDGRVVSERVARSSGSAALDDTALSLVRRASPFPTPPNGTGARDLSFIVPIRFRR